MIPVFPPPITELLNRANDVYQKTAEPQDLRPFLEEARNFHNTSRGFFLFFNKSRVEDEEVKNLTESFLGYCKKLDEQFDRFEEFIKTGKIEILLETSLGLQEASHNMTVISGKLKEIKKSFPAISSLPIVDDFIKVGINVYNDTMPHEALAEKLPFPILLLGHIEKDIIKFSENYSEAEDLNEDLAICLERMKTGIGAIQTYLDKKDKKDLLNGLNILGLISWELCEHLDKMGIYMSKKGKSQNLYLSEFLFHTENFLEDELELEDFKEKLKDFNDYFMNIRSELARFYDEFMVRNKVRKEFLPQLHELFEVLQGLFQGLTESIQEEEVDKVYIKKLVNQLKSEFEDLQDCKDEFSEAALTEKDLSKEPDMIQIRDIIKGLFNRIVTVSFLQENLLRVGGQNQARIERTNKCLDTKEDDNLKSLKEPLSQRDKAFQLLQKYVSDRKAEYLFEALEIIEETYDDLSEIDELLADWETSKDTVSCFKCSHKNQRGNKVCSGCGAKLPFSGIMEDTSTMEVVEEKVIPQEEVHEKKYSDDVIKLKGLIEEICEGKNKGEDFKKILEMIKSKLDTGKKEFREFTKPYLEKFPDKKEFKEKAQSLSDIFEELRNALGHIEKSFSDKKIDYLQEALGLFLNKVEKLNEIDKSLEEILQNKKAEDKKKK